MLGLKLFMHALKMLFHDRWAMARLTIMPLLIAVVIVFGVFKLFLGPAELGMFGANGADQGMTEPSARFILIFVFSLLSFMLLVFWGAVGWHRFVLLNEKPGVLLPKINGEFLRSYIWAAIRVGVVYFVMALPMIFLVTWVMSPGNDVAISVVSSVLMVFLSALFFRVSLVLPGAAVGQPMSLRQSWQATEGYFGALIVVAIAVALLNWLAELSLATQASGSFPLFLKLFLNWLSIVMAFSLLTTLYGVCVEKRTL